MTDQTPRPWTPLSSEGNAVHGCETACRVPLYFNQCPGRKRRRPLKPHSPHWAQPLSKHRHFHPSHSLIPRCHTQKHDNLHVPVAYDFASLPFSPNGSAGPGRLIFPRICYNHHFLRFIFTSYPSIDLDYHTPTMPPPPPPPPPPGGMGGPPPPPPPPGNLPSRPSRTEVKDRVSLL